MPIPIIAPIEAGTQTAARPGPARTVDLLISLARSDLLARYGRGRFRLLRWLLDPFALVGVYLVLVTVVLHRGGEAPGLTLACAVVAFQLLMTTVANSFDAVSMRASIIINMPFPRGLIPTASALTEGVAVSANLALLGLMMAIYGIAPTAAIVWLPLVLAVNFALAAAMAYPAALLGLSLRELRPLAISLVRALFFISPGLVSLETITGSTHDLLKFNPLTGLVEAYRAILIDGSAPAAWELLFPLAAAALLAVIFVPIYASEQRQFAKVV